MGFAHSIPIDGNWVHLTFVGEGSGTDLYVNGQFVDNSPRTIELPTQFIGARPRGTGSAAGTIDEVRIFDRALSETEVLELASLD